MSKFQIYLCGAMSGLSFEEYSDWRIKIKHYLENCECSERIKVFNPASYYNYESDTEYDTELEIMLFELHNLRKSNLLIVNFNNPNSLGSMAELGIAYDRGIPIIGLNAENKELHPWQQCMCSKIFDDVTKMIDYIEDYYLN